MKTNRERPDRQRRLVVGVTGASGGIYAVRFLKACLELGVGVDLIVSDYGKRLLIEECDLNLKAQAFESWLDARYGPAERTGELTLFAAPGPTASSRGRGSPSSSWTRPVLRS